MPSVSHAAPAVVGQEGANRRHDGNGVGVMGGMPRAFDLDDPPVNKHLVEGQRRRAEHPQTGRPEELEHGLPDAAEHVE